MMYSVLSAIATHLRAGLADVVPQPDAQITVQPARSGLKPDKLPRVYLIPEGFELVNQKLDPGDIQTDAELPSTVTVQKAFQQGFGLEVYGQDAIATEQLASLAMGILLTSSHDWVQAFNQGNRQAQSSKQPSKQSSKQSPKQPSPHYRSTDFTTQVSLHHIQLHGAEPCALEGQPGFCIKGVVLGQLEATRQIAESETPIQTVSIEYRLSERN
ncbi:MAG TPA: hypothetical protein V6D06_18535 [Trichocoleus sp.]